MQKYQTWRGTLGSFQSNIMLYAQKLVIIAIVIGTLVLVALVGRRPSMIFLAIPAGIIGGIILVRQPELSLIALVAGTLVSPIKIGTGTESELNSGVLLSAAALGLWIFQMALERKWQIFPSRLVLPIFAFAGIVLLAFLVGTQPLYLFAQTASIRSQAGGLMLFILSIGVLLTVGNQIRTQQWLEWLTWIFLVLGAIYITSRLIPVLRPIENLYIGGASGATGSLFWVWLVALSASQAIFNTKMHPILRVGLLGLTGATFFVAWTQGRSWASGYIPAGVTLGAIVWLRSWKLGLSGSMAAAIYLLVLNFDFIDSLVGSEIYSIDTRGEALRILLFQVLPINPLLGLGPANYYWYTPLFPILGYYVKFNSHNQYMDLLLQIGIIGTALYLWMMLSIGFLGLRLIKQLPDGFARAYVLGALGGLAGMMMAGAQGDWVIPFVYNIGMSGFRASVLGWVFLGGLMVIERLVSMQPELSTRDRAQLTSHD